jgi:hypothetical protein
MLVGYDLFGINEGLVLNTRLCISEYSKIEVSNFIIDSLLVSSDVTKPFHKHKYFDWDIDTLLNAHFQMDLEAGNVSTAGRFIDKVLFQKREVDSLIWEDVAEVDFNDKIQYKIVDTYVRNGFEYEYSMTPVAQGTVGTKRSSAPTKVSFEGNFLTDGGTSNYRLVYNIENGEVTRNVKHNIFEPIDSRFPIVVYGELDYKSGSMSALVYTGNYGEIDIKREKMAREQLFKFLTNGKPKVFKKEDGDLILINIVGSPQEIPFNSTGIASINFDYVEIAEFTRENLMMYGLSQRDVGYD